ncbi:uncharacterized protein METZ01_LOCUS229704, partial [marine metagenome]
INDQPTLACTGATATHTEDAGAVSLYTLCTVGSGADSAGDAEDEDLASVVITVTNVEDTAEILTIDGTAITLATSSSGDTGTLGLAYAITGCSNTCTVTLTAETGELTTEELDALLEAMTYTNSDQSPSTSSARVITVTTLDDEGSNVSPNDNTATLAVAATITVAKVNDAPTASGAASLAALNEDATATGATVNSLFGDTFSDTDGDSLGGICITSYDDDTAEGQWKYSTDAGTTWTAFNADISAASAGVFVNAADELAYDPAANWNGAANTLTAVLVDSSGTEPSTAATTDCSTTGTTTVYSTATVVLSHTITAVNDAPTASGSASLTALAEDGTPSTSTTVTSLFNGGFSDSADAVTDGSSANTIEGICITSYTEVSSEGQWKYSTDGSTFTAISSISAASAGLEIEQGSRLHFAPASNFNGAAATITAVLIDSSVSVTTNSVADDCSYSATGEYSTATMTLSHTVTAVNDAPTASGSASLTALAE